MTRLISKLSPGQVAVIRFDDDNRASESVFLGILGDGPARRARFMLLDGSGEEWEAHRHNGRWAYGPGSGRLSMINRPPGTV